MKSILALLLMVKASLALTVYDIPVSNQFDALMQACPPYCTIRIAQGTNFTMGAWGPKTGQRIIGAGKGLTVLQFPSGAVASNLLNRAYVMGVQPPYHQTNIDIEDMTLDANYQPGTITTLNGLGLCGDGNTVRNVEVIHTASYTASPTNYVECWGITIASFPFASSSGNLIEGCSVSGFTGQLWK